MTGCTHFSRCLEYSQDCDIKKPRASTSVALGGLCVKLSSCNSSENSTICENLYLDFCDSGSSTVTEFGITNPSHRLFHPTEGTRGNLKTLGSPLCDFHWKLTEVSTNLIHLNPRSTFIPKRRLNLSLQISCLDKKAEATEEFWFDVLKNVIKSDSALCEEKNCDCICIAKTAQEKAPSLSPPDSPKPNLPPRKPRNQSGDTLLQPKDSKQNADRFFSSYVHGDPKTGQDMVTAYIEADKLQQEQRIFR